MKKLRLQNGAQIVLKANKKEGWARELARYQGTSGPTTLIVRVERPEGADDDGLREVTWDQVELIPYERRAK